MSNKILVTGAAGFIGFHLIKSLLDDGFNVIGLDNLNDYYSGGQTKFKEFAIEPKVGRLAIFSNFFYRHSVTKVQRNERYTLAGWYTK